MPEHSMQMRAPRLRLAQSGSAAVGGTHTYTRAREHEKLTSVLFFLAEVLRWEAGYSL